MFQGGVSNIKDIFRAVQENLKVVSRVFYDYFDSISRYFMNVFLVFKSVQGLFKDISMLF